VLDASFRELAAQIGLEHRRQHGDAILVTLATAHDDLVRREVHVLDAEAAAFEHAQTGAVEQARHQAGSTVEPLEHGAYLVTCEDDRQPLGAMGAHDAVQPGKVDREHVPIEKEERAQRLVLGGRRRAAVDGQ